MKPVDEILPYYHPDTAIQKLGQKIYHDALSDRRGFRTDQIGIDPEDDVWLEIFENIGTVAVAAMKDFKE